MTEDPIARTRQFVRIPTSVLRDAGKVLESSDRAEMGVPSYTHPNPLVNWLFWRRLEVVTSLVPPGARNVMDFGCGTGVMLPTLAAGSARVWGVDLNLAAASGVCEHFGLENVRLIESARLGDVPAGSVDCVVAADVLEHVDDLRAVLKAIAGKMAPGSTLVVSAPTENLFYRLCRRVASVGGGGAYGGDYHHRGAAEIATAIRREGFELVSRRGLPLTRPGALSLFAVCVFRI